MADEEPPKFDFEPKTQQQPQYHAPTEQHQAVPGAEPPQQAPKKKRNGWLVALFVVLGIGALALILAVVGIIWAVNKVSDTVDEQRDEVTKQYDDIVKDLTSTTTLLPGATAAPPSDDAAEKTVATKGLKLYLAATSLGTSWSGDVNEVRDGGSGYIDVVTYLTAGPSSDVKGRAICEAASEVVFSTDAGGFTALRVKQADGSVLSERNNEGDTCHKP